MLAEHLLQTWGDLQEGETQLRMERIGALLIQAAATGENAPSLDELPNILGISSHIHAMAMVAVRENDQHDAYEYRQNLYGNLAWGAAHLQNLFAWAKDQRTNPWGETPAKQSPAGTCHLLCSCWRYPGPASPANLGTELPSSGTKAAWFRAATAASYTGGSHPVPNSKSPRTVKSGNALPDPRRGPAGCGSPRAAHDVDGGFVG